MKTFGEIMKEAYREVLVAFFIAVVVSGVIFCILRKDKWIDLRETWPSGAWISAQFLVVMPDREDYVVFNIPPHRLSEFSKSLKAEIDNSPKMENPQWDIYQLKIVTTSGTYKTVAFLSEDRVMADTWMSENLRKLLCEWGYPDPKKN